MRILIVEDERALCDTLAKSLKQKGYEVDACYDGDSALEWLLEEKYDLILLDLNLPGRDGMGLLKTLRERDRETRVLILSARSRISDKVEGLDCGANGLSGQALSSGGAEGAGAQSDPAQLCAARRGAALRRSVL